jgi:tetratricopeptide (TPR) repeat protein
MRFRNVTLLICCLFATSFAFAQSDSIKIVKNKFNDAVMQVYNQELKENPHDYGVLYSRANQYLMDGKYQLALDDVNTAMKYAPVNDKDTRVEQYMLRAQIQGAMGNKSAELTDLRSAAAIDPTSLSCATLLADAAYENGDYATARGAYQKLLSANNLNYDALAGMARVSVKEKNMGQAEEYMNRAVSLYPAEPRVYVNRADVLEMTGNYVASAQDLIMAMSVKNGDANAMSHLIKLSDSHYKDVITALSNTIDKAPKVGMFYYIRAAIAMRHCHYAAAKNDYRTIIDAKLYSYHGIYYNMAQCEYQLGKYDDALLSVGTAIGLCSTRPDYFTLQSELQLEKGDPTAALITIDKALALNDSDYEALEQKAKILLVQGDNSNALTALNASVAAKPVNADVQLLRAWVEKNLMNTPNLATVDYKAILAMESSDSSIYAMKGFALQGLGRSHEANQWADDIVKNPDRAGGEAAYYAAVLLSQTGNNDKALLYLEAALAEGYGSYRNLALNKEAYFSIEPLRALPGFKPLLARYADNFKK